MSASCQRKSRRQLLNLVQFQIRDRISDLVSGSIALSHLHLLAELDDAIVMGSTYGWWAGVGAIVAR